MSVLTAHVSSEFFLARADEPAALASMKRYLARLAESGCELTEYVLEPEAAAEASDMVLALGAAGFFTERDAEGNLVTLEWANDQLPYGPDNVKSLFDTFARTVRVGSFITLDEQGDLFTLTFEGPRVRLDGERRHEGSDTELLHVLRCEVESACEQGRLEDARALWARMEATSGGESEHRAWAFRRHAQHLLVQKEWDALEGLVRLAPREGITFDDVVGLLEDAEPEAALALARAGAAHDPEAAYCRAVMARRGG